VGQFGYGRPAILVVVERWAPDVELGSIGMETSDTIVLRRFHDGGFDDSMVDHPGQPAGYGHADGTVWTWTGRWRPLGGGVDRRLYDLVVTGDESGRPTA